MSREESIVESIRDAILEAFPGAMVRKRHGTVMGVAGDPDLYGCLPGGLHFEIEVKQKDNQATILQLYRLMAWRRAGAIVGVAHSKEEALEILRGHTTKNE
jgi:hypothetical protein